LQSSKLVLGAALALSIFFVSIASGEGQGSADDPAALLKKGIDLFNTYKFAEARKVLHTARKVDNKLKRLTNKQRSQLGYYLDEAVKGRRQYEEAVEFIKLADKLISGANVGIKQLEQAERFYKQALARKKYLPGPRAADVKTGLDKVAKLRKVISIAEAMAPKTTSAKPTGKVVGKAQVKPTSTRPAKPGPKSAKKPKKPKQAKAKPKVVRRVAKPTEPAQPTLLDQILQQRRIQKQQALAAYADGEKRVRAAVDARAFLAARDALSQVHQEIRVSRRLFSQAEFERLVMQIDSLAKFVDAEEQAYQQSQIRAQMKEADKKRAAREVRVQQEKFDKITELFRKARTLRRARKYDEAIAKCQQVLGIEPRSVRASDFIEDTKDLATYRSQDEVDQTIRENTRELFAQSDASRVPAVKEIRYPPDFQSKTQRRRKLMQRMHKTPVGESPARLTELKLQTTIVKDISVLRGTLRNAFLYFRKQGIKLFPRWDALEIEGVTPDMDVDFESLEGLEDISLRSTLELLLKTLGPEVNYAINTDGFVVVSARGNLILENLTPVIGQLETRVYDISDIMAYQVSLSSIPEVQPEQEEEAIEFEEIEAGEFEELDSLEDMVETLIEMITTLVRPLSWQVAGGEGTVNVWRKRKLVVFQSPEVHDEIAALLEDLRATQTVQITIEATFVTVSSNFLENIGVDLDVIFNQGRAGYDLTGAQNTWGNTAAPGFGSAIVQPRVFSQLGALPVSPMAGVLPPPGGWFQPYGHPGLVPVNGNTGFRSTKFTPIPLLGGSNNLVTPQDTGLPGNLSGEVGAAFQVMGAFLDDLQVNFLLEATQMDRYSSIAQSPKVTMQNGTLGYIAVQTDVPYVEEVEVELGETAGGTEPQIETMGFGTVLAVRPSTTDLRYVNLYVVPQVTLRAPDADLIYESTVVSEGAVSILRYLYPGRRSTRVETTVSVPDEGTLLLGGLKMAGEIEREAGVPVLNKMPILKRFFSNRSLVKDNFTLLILIKPKILVREELEPGYFSGL